MSASLAFDRGRERAYARDLGRAFGGALLFSLLGRPAGGVSGVDPREAGPVVFVVS